MALTSLTTRALSRATLARQMLLRREKVRVEEAIERLFGMQAQLARPPHVGLFSRLEGFGRSDLAAAIERRAVVRATLMRGTLHMMTAKDYAAFRPVLQIALDHGLKSVLRDRMKSVDVATVVSTARAFFDSPHTFDELRDSLGVALDPRARAFAARLLVPLVQVADGSAWSYPTVARFVAAERWIKERPPKKAAGLADLVRRYLASFGPASVADAQTWSGIPALRETFEALRDELVAVRDERKRELFDLPRSPRPGEDAPAPPIFLPEFDNLVLAYADRRRFVSDTHRKAIYLPGLRVAPTFLVGGVVAGTWKTTRAKSKATLQVVPFESLPRKSRDALEEEAAQLVRFVEPEATTFDVRI
jgi:hypothetical protein